MNKQTSSLILILVFLLQGCASITSVSEVAQSEQIRESLFKYLLIKSNTENNKLKMKVYYFLGVEGKDPSESLMRKMKNIKRNIYPSSQARVEKNKVTIRKNIELYGLLRHKKLGGIGVSYGLGKIKWVSKNKVTMSWGSYLSSLNASHNIAILELRNNKWVVTSSKQKTVAKSKPNKSLHLTHLSWASSDETAYGIVLLF